MKKKILIFTGIILLLWLGWCRLYSFDAAKASGFMRANAESRSIHCCAWYTMRGLQTGGCPAIILPAQWYSWFMPIVQFEEVSVDDYSPQAGDIVVFERPSSHSLMKISQWWGHIAMYDGEQWVSDFKQKRMNPYKSEVPYKLYRFKGGR